MTVVLKRSLKQWLPYWLHQRLDVRRRALPRLACPVCGRSVLQFETIDRSYLEQCDRHQVRWSLFTYETNNVLAYHCPRCGAADRTRLYALYLRQVLAGWGQNTPFHVLDIAPTSPLTRFLKRYPHVRYRSADLYSQLADDRVDVMDMHIYADSTYDFVIFSHVLEHLQDDRRALREVYRVLKPNARAIIMAPIDLSRGTIDEDPTVTDPRERWRRFGQDDHVRVYSKAGFLERLKEAGFAVEQLDSGWFGDSAFMRAGIHPRSVLYVATRGNRQI
ncbi:MAG: methyltransferase domain-containing protein [Kiritimatiellae bacterium]|nr:methyltransferase domain-containing protein [Kiritimatiellia bacterium]